MAGDWIKIRTDLSHDTAVMIIADALAIEEDTALGLLLRFWSWADKQTTDGTIPAITSAHIDRLLGRPGFADVMRRVGWLSGSDRSLYLPRFDRHNGSTAKARALESEAKRLRRQHQKSDTSPPELSDMSDTCPTFVRQSSDTLSDQNREEKRRGKTVNHTPPAREPSSSSSADPIPTLAEVLAYATGPTPVIISQECAQAFWDTQESHGWITNHGHAIVKWRSALHRYAQHWNQHEQGKGAAPTRRPGNDPPPKKHRDGEYPQEQRPLPML